MFRTACSIRDDVVLERTAHGEQLQLEIAWLGLPAVQRRLRPLALIREAHIQRRLVRMEAFDLRTYGEIAVAANGRIPRHERDATHWNHTARQVCAEKQVPAAVTPMPGSI